MEGLCQIISTVTQAHSRNISSKNTSFKTYFIWKVLISTFTFAMSHDKAQKQTMVMDGKTTNVNLLGSVPKTAEF